jgi:hypothetical protein
MGVQPVSSTPRYWIKRIKGLRRAHLSRVREIPESRKRKEAGTIATDHEDHLRCYREKKEAADAEPRAPGLLTTRSAVETSALGLALDLFRAQCSPALPQFSVRLLIILVEREGLEPSTPAL